MINKWRNVRVGVTASLVAVLVGACGGGGDSESASQNDPPPPGPGSNSPPTIQGQPGSTVLAGQQYSFQPAASDPDEDTLTFSATNLPAWASFDSSTGRVSGTPESADVGAYQNITVQVSDGTATASLSAFSITVTDVATGSATLSWTPPTQNTDDSTLTDLAGYEIRYGRSAADLSTTISVDNESVSTYVIENLTSGTWYFAVIAVNAQGVNSTLSNVASKTI